LERVVPNSDAGEEVGARVSFNITWLQVCDAPGVDNAAGDVLASNQVSQPLRRELSDLVVECGHASTALPADVIRHR